MRPEQIIDFIRRRRFPMGSETELQVALAAELTAAGIPFERERRLSAKDIVDFMFPGGSALELKIKGSPRSHYGQCVRYCEHEVVTSIVLATNVAMGFPPEILGKPSYLVSFGRSWL